MSDNVKPVKQEVVTQFRIHPTDTGSAEVQVALLTKRIEYLTQHFAKNPKDGHSRTGMLRMVSRRKGLLQHLKDENPTRYKKLIGALDLRK